MKFVLYTFKSSLLSLTSLLVPLFMSLLISMMASLAMFNFAHAATADPSLTQKSITFDHIITGFPLDGNHDIIDCQACHVGGVFDELPTRCDACHDGLLAPGKTPNHIPTNAPCASCHTPAGFSVQAAAAFDHSLIAGTSCYSCHDGNLATTKSLNHLPTSNVCEACHQVGAWVPVSVSQFDHTQATAACAACHDGVNASGKSVGHIPTTAPCEACHTTNPLSWLVISFNHANLGAGLLGVCQSCHDGVQATGKNPQHLNTQDVCASCHEYTAWVPAIAVDHGLVLGTCSSCHDGVISIGKTPNHIPTTQECDICHTVAQWLPAGVDHTNVVDNCISCHDGVSASGKIATHISSSDSCESCHVKFPANWAPVTSAAVDHTQVIGVCSGCHDNVIAIGKNAGHIPTSDECDVCHQPNAWSPAPVDHSGFTGNCVSCHTGIAATGKSPSHIKASNECQICHQKFPSVWANVAASAVDHAQVEGACISCHDGLVASGKSQLHISSSDQCDACHLPGPIPWVPVAATAVDHTQVSGSCFSCHNGLVASTKSVTHISTSNLCEACHTSGLVPWIPVPLGGVDHTQVVGSCSSCHDGTIASGKSALHIPTNQECDVCHGTRQWAPAAVDHTTFAGNCITCHDGVLNSGKLANHINTTDACDGCHLKFPAKWLQITPADVNHTQVIGTCISCHDNVVASGKGLTHIDSSNQCDSCHASGPTPWAPVANAAVDHTQVNGNCISCHDGAIASGKSVSHITTSDKCEACHQTAPALWTPVAVAAVDHLEVLGSCISCHDGNIASGRSATHIASSTQCDACHNVGPAPWVPWSSVDHTQVTGSCSSCHDGVIATGKNATHIPTVEECDVCHGVQLWVPAAVDHTAIFTDCLSCHDGVSASGKSATHISSSDLCETCHQKFPAVWAPVAPSAVDHNQVSGSCVSCHDGAIATGQPVTHISTTTQCDACHLPGPIPFAPVLASAVDHVQVVGTCSSCHDGVIATGKNATHVPTTAECDICHGVKLWIPAAVDHSTIVDNCISCHDGIAASGKSATHINTSELCETCHAVFPSLWTPVANSAVDHAQVNGVCSSCHDGVSASGKSATHIATTDECDVCHVVTTWLGATIDHSTIITNCISCHDGATASGKTAVHMNTSDQCEFCHAKFPVTWTPVAAAAVNHSQVLGSCDSCHDGVIATGKIATHINTTPQCDACHQSGPTPFAPVLPSAVDHTQVIGVCSSCHDGVVAIGKNATHVPTIEECDVCHGVQQWIPAAVDHAPIVDNCISCHDGVSASAKNPAHINSSDLCETCHQKFPALWAPVAPSAVDHTQVNGVCSSCHDGIVASGKSVNHIPTVDECDTCHSVSQWIPAAVDHAPIINNCISCHDGVAASGKSPTHINTSELCETCHAKFPATWIPVAVAAVDHAQVVGTCFSCHNGTVASGKSATHIGSTSLCDTCHEVGPVPWVPVAPSAVDHNQVIGVCSSCHDGLVATGKNATHVPTVEECNICHGVTQWIPAGVDHATIVDNCISCHDGVTASGKSATHIGSSDLCETCHEKFPALWAPVLPAAVDHTQVTGACITCHDGTIASGRSASHISTTTVCDACHQQGPTPWAPVAPSAVDHSQVIGVCSSCHDGIIATGKNATHVPTVEECDICHGSQQWIPAAVDHATFSGNCISCHDGITASGKTAAHIGSSDQCDACHAKFPSLWVPVAPAAVNHNNVVGTCISCHDGAIASGKSASHISSSVLCDSCHQPGPVPWAPVVANAVDHTQVVGVCSSCHDGIIATGKNATHIPTVEECDACHSVQQWIPAAVDHTPIIDNCISCHDAVTASGKSPAHINTSDLCETCHAKFPANWAPVAAAAVDHGQVIGTCISCHDGTVASGKSAAHITSSGQCDRCHQQGPTPWTPVAVAAVDHTQVTGTCISCHDGNIASGKSINHISTSTACDACHLEGPIPWIPVLASAVDHAEVLGVCSSCHNGSTATGKNATHVPTIEECDVCHGVQQWIPAAVDHAPIINDCISCHDGVFASGKSVNHINTSNLCETCHTKFPSLWTPVAPSAVDHNQVIGTCSSCHNGTLATGKSVNHIATTAECDTCHVSTTWLGATVDHATFSGNCISCHDAVTASGKSAAHINTSDTCDACHAKFPSLWQPVLPSAVDHTQVVGTCVSCHNGTVATGKSVNHISSSSQCELCHTSNNWVVLTSQVNHQAVVGSCFSCHDGVIATGKLPTHISSLNQCDSCHLAAPTPWRQIAPAAVDHTQVVGTCISCHDGIIASGRSGQHISTSDQCDLCHQTAPANWTPVAPSAVDHTQVNGVCSSCHDGIVASGKGGNHIATTQECDVCHNSSAWVPATITDHTGFSGNCITCHDGIIASGKNPAHINTSNQCDACHQSFPALWAPVAAAAVNHTQVVGTCVSCHNGTTAGGKSGTHINSTNQCDLCHQAAPTPWAPLAASAVNHTQVNGTCTSCHNNVIAIGKPGGHVVTTLECDNCHIAGLPISPSWLPTTAPDHAAFFGNCFTCHNGTDASGKSPNHINSSTVCDACHQKFPATWTPVQASAVDHLQVIGSCSSCHNGTIATGKSINHVPTTAECDTCHLTTAQWLGASVSHTNILNNCLSCHNGTIASGKNPNHINTSNLCETCHQKFPSLWAPVAAAAVNHAQVIGTCVSCHNGTVASGKSGGHINSTNQCDLCHQSGPTPWTPVAASAVNHTQVNGTCTSCHNNVIAIGKPGGHIVTTLECDSCHAVGLPTSPSWLPTSVPDHATFFGNCVSCHDGTTASGKNPTHINSSTVCDACHQKFPSNWAPVAAGAVDHLQVIGTCSSCHNGTIATGKSVNHVPTTAECDACHVTAQWAGATVNHATINNNCTSCHNGIIASGKSPTHINTSNLCETCHQKFPSTWAPVAAGAVDHLQVIGTCSSCHNGTIATGKSVNHVPTTAQCDTCHVTAQWAGATVNHATINNNCTSCHNGIIASGKSPTHINTSNLCETCHQKFPALWTPVAAAAVNHLQVIGTCVSCHNGTVASGKSGGHINSTNQCDLCHQPGPTPWTPVAASAVNHTQVNGTCTSCHNNVIAIGKPGGHIVTTLECDSCHSSGLPTSPSWLPTSVPNHATFFGNCISCHDGTTASGKNPTHINSSTVCDACHQKFPSNWAPVAAGAVDHLQVIGTCSSCHNGTIATGKSVNHVPTTAECDTCHVTAQWAGATVNHATINNNCTSCHNGTIASGKNPTHINTSNLCENCHQKLPAAWAPVAASAVDHTQVIGTCSLCHNNVIAIGKPGGHVVTNLECDVCHQAGLPVSPSWLPTSVPDHTTFVGNCITCHNGTDATGKNPTHINTSDVCDACHQKFPANWAPVAAGAVDHTQVIGTCISCHNGNIAGGKSVNHIPTNDICDACHVTSSWAIGSLSISGHTALTVPNVVCEDCHAEPGGHCDRTGGNTVAAEDCDACHVIPPTPWANSTADCPPPPAPPPPAPAPGGGPAPAPAPGGGPAPAPAPAPGGGPAPAPTPTPGPAPAPVGMMGMMGMMMGISVLNEAQTPNMPVFGVTEGLSDPYEFDTGSNQARRRMSGMGNPQQIRRQLRKSLLK